MSVESYPAVEAQEVVVAEFTVAHKAFFAAQVGELIFGGPESTTDHNVVD